MTLAWFSSLRRRLPDWASAHEEGALISRHRFLNLISGATPTRRRPIRGLDRFEFLGGGNVRSTRGVSNQPLHGELLKLGFEVPQSSVAKYMVNRRGPPSQGLIRDRDRTTAPSLHAGCAPWASGTSLLRQPRLGRMALPNGRSDRSGASVDHFVVLGEAHLRQILRAYARYYNNTRTHRSLDKDASVSRPVLHAAIAAAPTSMPSWRSTVDLDAKPTMILQLLERPVEGT